MGTGGVKRPGREADHSPPTNAEIKKTWIYTSIPICLHGVVLNWLSTGGTLPYRHLLPETERENTIASNIITRELQQISICEDGTDGRNTMNDAEEDRFWRKATISTIK
jgi:hypothetical protein